MEKIKHFLTSEQGKDFLIVCIVILVGLGSFGLGRLSKGNSASGIKIEYADQVGNVISAISETQNSQNNSATTANTNGKNYFASKIGRKYYGVGCDAGKSIKVANRVYFNTKAEAEAAGYELSSSCR